MGSHERVTWAPERSQRQQEPERRRPARGRHGPLRAVGAARGCSCRAPGPARGSREQPERLHSGAGHGSLCRRRSSRTQAGGASWAAPLRALPGSAGPERSGGPSSAPRVLAGGPALGWSCVAPAAAAAAPAPSRPSHPGRAAASARASCRPPLEPARESERGSRGASERKPGGGRAGEGGAGRPGEGPPPEPGSWRPPRDRRWDVPLLGVLGGGRLAAEAWGDLRGWSRRGGQGPLEG